MNPTNKTILIVDDDQDILESLAYLLEEKNYQTLKASNGIEAFNFINNSRIDLLITDLLMPEMDGLELIEFIQMYSPSLPFIIISGGSKSFSSTSNYDYINAAEKLTGTNYVFRKPFDVQDLIKAVDELISQQ